MNFTLVLKESDYRKLKKHLFPLNDKREFSAIMLCHHGKGKISYRLMVKEIILVPKESYAEQSSHYLSWAFSKHITPEKIEAIDKEGLSVFTIHSHPKGYDQFSKIDDKNDKEMFYSINNWFDDDRSNGSAIMLPDGKIIARVIKSKEKFIPIQKVSVIGENITIWHSVNIKEKIPDYGLKIRQTFGKGTFNILRQMKVGVVGCSGTGSIIVELLMRNCIGSLVLVDPDIVEEKNLNRILNVGKTDSKNKIHKVTALKTAILKTGMNTKVDTYPKDTKHKDVIEALTDCDVIFGCVDSVTGRYHLECLASAYFIPYFDIGVYLSSDSHGKIKQADVATHYIHPESNSLMDRGVYTTEQLTAEGWKKSDKSYYKKNKMAGYLQAVGEDQPAVISINMQGACLAFNDFLARIHGFRLDDNAQFNVQKFQLVQGAYLNAESDKGPDSVFKKYAGMGGKSFLIQSLTKE